jgi:hypothetical protein
MQLLSALLHAASCCCGHQVQYCTSVLQYVQLHVMCEMHGLAYMFWLSRTVVGLLQELRDTTTNWVVLAAAASAMSVLPPSRPVC